MICGCCAGTSACGSWVRRECKKLCWNIFSGEITSPNLSHCLYLTFCSVASVLSWLDVVLYRSAVLDFVVQMLKRELWPITQLELTRPARRPSARPLVVNQENDITAQEWSDWHMRSSNLSEDDIIFINLLLFMSVLIVSWCHTRACS